MSLLKCRYDNITMKRPTETSQQDVKLIKNSDANRKRQVRMKYSGTFKG